METLRDEMTAAGARLNEFQQVELKLSERYSSQPNKELIEQWKTARRAVECVAEEYVRAIRRYSEAVENQSPAAAERPLGACSRCGGRLNRVHRSYFQRLRYLEAYLCQQCKRQDFVPRFAWLNGGAPEARVPAYGNSRSLPNG